MELGTEFGTNLLENNGLSEGEYEYGPSSNVLSDAPPRWWPLHNQDKYSCFRIQTD